MRKHELYESVQEKLKFTSNDIDIVRNTLNKIVMHEQKHLDKINNEYKEINEALQKDKNEGEITEKEYKKRTSKNTENYNNRRKFFKEESGLPKEYYELLQPFFDSKDSLLIKNENFKIKIHIDTYPFVLLYKEVLTYEKKVMGKDFKIQLNLSYDKKKVVNLEISIKGSKEKEMYAKISMELEPKLASFFDTEQEVDLDPFTLRNNQLEILDIITFDALINLDKNDIESTILLTMDYPINITKSSLYPAFQQGIKEFLTPPTPERTNRKKNSKIFKQNK